jgi:hypothetical protein
VVALIEVHCRRRIQLTVYGYYNKPFLASSSFRAASSAL